jgi:hypothetical protein
VQSQVKGGGSYLSAHDLRQVFAVGENESEFLLDITWPSGQFVTISDLQPGGRYTVPEPLQMTTDFQ